MPALETAQKCDSTGHFVLILACFLPLPSDFDKGPAGEGGGSRRERERGHPKIQKGSQRKLQLKRKYSRCCEESYKRKMSMLRNYTCFISYSIFLS